MSTTQRAARIRASLGHPVIDGDGHWMEPIPVFLEYLGGHGGAILEDGRIVVNSAAGIRALTRMRDQIYRDSVVPRAALTWHEEETRFAFQNGRLALMRNWPYAFSLMADSTQSRVAGRYAVAPMPAEPGAWVPSIVATSSWAAT